jgi:hypothetical protein
LRKSPGFTATAVLALAVGVESTSSIFSLLDAVMLRPLPFRDAGRLVADFGAAAGLWAQCRFAADLS